MSNLNANRSASPASLARPLQASQSDSKLVSLSRQDSGLPSSLPDDGMDDSQASLTMSCLCLLVSLQLLLLLLLLLIIILMIVRIMIIIIIVVGRPSSEETALTLPRWRHKPNEEVEGGGGQCLLAPSSLSTAVWCLQGPIQNWRYMNNLEKTTPNTKHEPFREQLEASMILKEPINCHMMMIHISSASLKCSENMWKIAGRPVV